MTHILRAAYQSARHQQHCPSATVPPVLPAKGRALATALPAAVLIPCVVHTKLIHHQCHPSPCHTTPASCHGARCSEQTPMGGSPRHNVQLAHGGARRLFPPLCSLCCANGISHLRFLPPSTSQLPSTQHCLESGKLVGSKEAWI